MIGKTEVKLILLMTVVNLVFACLVTNCPRGGKRGSPDLNSSSNNINNSELKKCKLGYPRKELCFGIYCSSQVLCNSKNHCTTQKVYCNKRFYKPQKACVPIVNSQRFRDSKPSSIILTKILTYNLEHPSNQ